MSEFVAVPEYVSPMEAKMKKIFYRSISIALAMAAVVTQTACDKVTEVSVPDVSITTPEDVIGKSDILITEVMASNDTVLKDSFGEYSDWIELYNTTDHPIDLKDCCLSDDSTNTDQFSIPDITIPAHEYIVVFASGRETLTDTGELHTSFKISAGESVCLFYDGELLTSVTVPDDLPADYSYGLVDSSGTAVYMAEPTPKAQNTGFNAGALDDMHDDTVGVVLNEWMTKNECVMYDEYGDCHDWVELRNLSDAPVALGGYGLSDDPADPLKWVFPSVTIQPDGYLIVILSGNDIGYTSDSTYIHADFKLSENDTQLRLSNPKGVMIDSVELIPMPGTVSHGRDVSDTKQLKFFTYPTPGRANTGSSFESLEDVLSRATERLFVNEVCAVSSDRTKELPDEDWIELYNNTPTDINMAGWSLSKDVTSLRDFIFPAVTVPAYGYLVVTASDVASVNTEQLSTGFKIDHTGDTLYLSDNNGVVTDCFSTGYQQRSVTSGRVIEGQTLRRYFFSSPTKGEANDIVSAATAYAQPVRFVTESTTLTADSHLVMLETDQRNAAIYYTLDGTQPTNESTMYTSPIELTESASVRAIVYADGLLPSKTVAQTFLVDEPHELDVVCLTCDPDDLYDYSTGIWADGPGWTEEFPHLGANYWKDWEREVYFEYYDTNGQLGVGFSAGMRNHGQYSRAADMKSLSINAKEAYGSDTIRYPFFGEDGLKEFDNLLLRTGGQDWVVTNLVDAYCARVVKGQMDLDIMDEVPVALYINGKYHGMYYIREKINESYIYDHSGIEANDLDAIKGNNIVETGSSDAYKELLNYIKTHDLSKQEHFDYVASQIDVEEWTNYWITETFIGNTDTGNIRFYNSRSGNGKWRWILFDLDWALFITTYEGNSVWQMTDPNGHGAGDMFDTTISLNMLKNENYKQYFIETYAKYMHTVFDKERMLQILDDMVAQVDSEMQRHCAVWNNPSYSGWQKNVQRLRMIVEERWAICANNLRKTFSISDARMAELFPELYS